jgi:hypothetical protein
LSEDEKDLIPASSPGETALDIAAFVSSAVPYLGGPVGSIRNISTSLRTTVSTAEISDPSQRSNRRMLFTFIDWS